MTDRSAPNVTFEELIRQMPESLKETLPLVHWHLDRLWALDLPVEFVEVGEFTWLLDLPLWQIDGHRFQVSPNDVANSPERFSAHVARAMESDLAYPIHLVQHNERWVILDGFHRLLKAVLINQRTLSAMRLSPEDLASIAD